MKRAQQCRKCGCDERHACIEFDSKGRGYPCWWVEKGLCSACFEVSGRAALLAALTEKAVPLVVAPQLAGYVARPR